MKFLIDECLHPSLVNVARVRHFEARHVNWMGLNGTADWNLMPRIVAEDFTFVTNNGIDFRRLYAKEPLHAGLIIFIRQVSPDQQRALFAYILDRVDLADGLINEVIEAEMSSDGVVFTRVDLPKP